jgi:lactoylglutathione lyase
MKFGYTIIYVADVLGSLTFFEIAFGFTKKFIHDAGDYGELDTGETILSFASHALGATNLPNGYISAESSIKPLGIEIAFVTESVEASHQKAIAAGATEIKPPLKKPWGQIVSYLRCPDGILVELCSPVS